MIIVTGTIAYDYIMDFPGLFSDHILPKHIHNINLSFIVNKFGKRRGGTAGNVSYTLGLLNTSHLLFSYAGKDFGEYKKAFTKLGINLTGVTIDKKNYTSTGFAMTDKTNNQIWGYFYGASENIVKLNINTVATKNDFVLIGPSGAAGSMSLVKQCIKRTIPYMFDPGFILTQITDKELAEGITHATYLIGNDYEINLIASRVKSFSKITREKIIITTLGNKGSVIDMKGEKQYIQAAPVKSVIDPTGAGDAWRGGFLAGIQRGFSLKIAAQMGSIASAYTIEEYGTQEHLYSRENFCNRYRQTYNTVLHL